MISEDGELSPFYEISKIVCLSKTEYFTSKGCSFYEKKAIDFQHPFLRCGKAAPTAVFDTSVVILNVIVVLCWEMHFWPWRMIFLQISEQSKKFYCFWQL